MLCIALGDIPRLLSAKRACIYYHTTYVAWLTDMLERGGVALMR